MFIRLLFRWCAQLTAACTAAVLAASGLGNVLPAAPPYALPLGSSMNLDIYVIDAARGVFANLSKNELWDGEPAVSPDGRQVVFTSLMSGNGSIYVADLDTLALRRLTNDYYFNGQAAWSPDGTQIVYASERNSGRNLYLINADGSRLRQLMMTAGQDFAPSWSPDGERIAFSMSGSGDPGEIYVYDLASRDLLQFTFYRGIDVRPAWSPDGRWLAFASDRDGSMNLYMLATACLDKVEGCQVENPRQLTRSGVNAATLWWSGDGQHLLYWERTIGTPEIYALAADCDILPNRCVPERVTHLEWSLVLRQP